MSHAHPGGFAFSPDGRRFAVAWSAAGIAAEFAQVGDTQSGRMLEPLLWHGDGVAHVEFSPDGRSLVTAGQDSVAKLWDATTLTEIAHPLRHQKAVACATFSPDSRYVATASHDHTARVWDVRTGEAVTPWLMHEARVDIVKFTPDGRHLITASGVIPDSYVRFKRARIRLWSFGPEESPVDELMTLAHFLRGARLNEAGSETALTADELQLAHEKLRSLDSTMLKPLLQTSELWHQRLAQSSEDSGDWNGAIFHLALLIALNPADPDFAARLAQARAKLGDED